MLQKIEKICYYFNYIDNILIVLSVTTGGVSIISFSSVIGAPTGIARASLTLIVSLTTEIVKKKLLDITRKKQKEHDKILMLAKSKVNSIDTLIS